MSTVSFSKEKAEISIEGEISFQTVKRIRDEGDSYFRCFDQKTIHVNFQRVDRADLSVMALLVAWLRTSSKQKLQLKFINVPLSVLRIAEICGIKDLLKKDEY